MRDPRGGPWSAVLVAVGLTACTAHAGNGAGEWLDSIRRSAELQEFLDRSIDGLLAKDARLRDAKVRVALLDLSHGEPPVLAHRHDDVPILIRQSSNQATRRVFARLRDLHCVNPTYDGIGDLFGRDAQFIRDASVTGGLGGSPPNRQAMTANGTAKLLAKDRALTPADSAVVRERMRRDPKEQRHLAARIAGGATRVGELEVYAKSGTWGPIYADAGIVRHVKSGRQMVIVVFTEANPAYRGEFIADLTELSARRLLVR